MDTELLRKLVTDPGHFPFYLCLAFAVIVVVKVIGIAADAAAKRVWAEATERKGWRTFFGVAVKAVAIALVIYLGNAMYWTRVTEQIPPPPSMKPIVSCEATVEIVLESDDKQDTHFVDTGGYLAFGTGERALLTTAAMDSWGKPLGSNRYSSRGVFHMPATDSAAGKPVSALRDAEYVQVGFPRLPMEYRLIEGRAICVINNEVRIEMFFPSQTVEDGKVLLRDMSEIRKALE